MRGVLGILTAAVIAAAVPAARADMRLTLVGTQGGASGTQTTSYALPPGTGAGSFSFGGFTVNYTVSAPLTGPVTTQSVILNATVTGIATAATDFSYVLTGVPFSTPGAGSGFLQSSLTTANGAALQAGTSLTGTATYVRNNNIDTVSDPTVNGTIGQSTVALGSPFLLQTSGNFSIAANTQVSQQFTSTAAVALPEPASVLAGLAGLPCMGGVLAFARRRVRRAAPATAA